MQTDYTDDQTARVREIEGSSAGHQTQPLSLPPGYSATRSGSGSFSPISLTLILLGGCMLVTYLLTALSGNAGLPTLPLPDAGQMQAGLILLTIGSCFLFFAFWRRIYPFLIPGCILAGLSIGVPFAALTHGVSVLWGLSLAFLGVFLISRLLFRIQATWTIWPIFPTVILFAVGVIIAITTAPTLLRGGIALLPPLLIVLGLLLGARRTP